MAISLIEYAPSSQNQRVEGFEVPGEEQPKIYSTASLLAATDYDELINAAYRQIFNEQQMLKSNRQTPLESQLRCGQITVREFIRGLATSSVFRTRTYNVNNNYRFAQLCVQRILGREVYSDREKISWSIVLATKGLQGFIDALISSDEYLENFGDYTVPYQRRRILPQKTTGELPFARMPRYGADHLAKLEALGNDFSADRIVDGGSWLPPESIRQFGAIVTYIGAALVATGVAAVVLSWFGWIKL